MEWTMNMLAGRNLTVHHRDITIEGKPDTSSPQGGVLSPLLWYFMVNDLLLGLQRGFCIYGYADVTAMS
jgi:hypothetical protein